MDDQGAWIFAILVALHLAAAWYGGLRDWLMSK